MKVARLHQFCGIRRGIFRPRRKMGWPTGFEPATARSTIWGSNRAELWPPTGLERLDFQTPRVKFGTVGTRNGNRRGTSIGIALNHVEDPVQLHLAERTSPFTMLVPKGQASEMFALHQHHFVRRRQGAVFIFIVRGRGWIRHTRTIGQPAPIGSPDFVKNSTALGIPEPAA